MLYNLSQVYGLSGEYKKSMDRSRKTIFLEMLSLQAYSWCRGIYNIAWCYGKIMLKEQDERKKQIYKAHCKEFFVQSYSLAKFYQDKSIEESIKEKLELWKIL